MPSGASLSAMTSPERALLAARDRAWQDLPDRVPAEDLVEEISADPAPDLLPDFLRIHYTNAFNGPGAPVG